MLSLNFPRLMSWEEFWERVSNIPAIEWVVWILIILGLSSLVAVSVRRDDLKVYADYYPEWCVASTKLLTCSFNNPSTRNYASVLRVVRPAAGVLTWRKLPRAGILR